MGKRGVRPNPAAGRIFKQVYGQTGTTALTVGVVATELGQNIWVAIAAALVLALAIGFLNGWLVTRTGRPKRADPGSATSTTTSIHPRR